MRPFFVALKRSLIAHKSAILMLLLGVFLPLQIFGDLAEDVWEQGGFPFDVPVLQLGVHYPSDVLAGWLAALSWALGVSLVIRPNQESSSRMI